MLTCSTRIISNSTDCDAQQKRRLPPVTPLPARRYYREHTFDSNDPFLAQIYKELASRRQLHIRICGVSIMSQPQYLPPSLKLASASTSRLPETPNAATSPPRVSSPSHSRAAASSPLPPSSPPQASSPLSSPVRPVINTVSSPGPPDGPFEDDFKDQIYDVYRYLPPATQVVVLSATLPYDVLEMTTKFMTDPSASSSSVTN